MTMQTVTDAATVLAADNELQQRAAVSLAADPLTQKNKIVARVAERFGVDPAKMLHTMRETCFAQPDKSAPVSNEQMMMLLIVCEQYGLNPFVKEIYAFVGKSGGIVPVVSIDGWLRIINSRPDFDGCEFTYSEAMSQPCAQGKAKMAHDWVEVRMYRKNHAHPMAVREYLDEIFVPGRYPGTGPWYTHTKRMQRHKTMIQGARYAFGLAGIYDEDEGQRIMAAQQGQSVTDNSADFSDFQQRLEQATTGAGVSTVSAIEHAPAQVVAAPEPAPGEGDQDPAPEARAPIVAVAEAMDEPPPTFTIASLRAELDAAATVGALDLVGTKIRLHKRKNPGEESAALLRTYTAKRQELIA